MAAQKQRSGLVSYTGDSEISDSEDERTSVSNSPPLVPLGTSSLGIPPSKPRELATPPTFIKPEVHSAPVMGLVDYGVDDEDHGDVTELDESASDEVFLRQQLINQVQNNTTDNSSQDDTLDAMETENKSPNEEIPLIEITDEVQSDKGESDIKDDTPLFLPTTGIRLPPEPPTKCSKALQDKIVALLQKKASSGIDVNSSVQNRKDFRNPSIYERLVQLRNLDEFGTNYPPHRFDPHEWDEDSHYDNLLKAQKKAYEKKEKARLDRTKIEFVTGTKRPAPPVQSLSTGGTTAGSSNVPSGADVLKKRKSKWDVGSAGSGAESGGSKSGSPAGAVSKERPPLLGTAPVGVPLAAVGAQAIAQATQLNRELSKLKPK